MSEVSIPATVRRRVKGQPTAGVPQELKLSSPSAEQLVEGHGQGALAQRGLDMASGSAKYLRYLLFAFFVSQARCYDSRSRNADLDRDL